MRLSTVSLTAAVAACVLSAPAFAGVVAPPPLTTFTFGGAAWQYGSDAEGDPAWVNYPNINAQVGSTGGINGLHMFGTNDGGLVLTMDGGQYQNPSSSLVGNRLLLSGIGTIDGAHWQHPQDFIRTMFNYQFDASAGLINHYLVETSFTVTDAEGNFITGVGSGTGFADPFEPGLHGLQYQFEDRFGAENIAQATRFSWNVALYFQWTGMGESDTFSLTIPNNSIDFNTLPTPGAATVLAAAGLLASRRRR